MENLTPNENEVLNAINANPGISAGQLGKRLSLDRNYARRVADRLIGFGHATKRDNGNGFGFFPAGASGYAPIQATPRPTSPRTTWSPQPALIEGTFVDPNSSGNGSGNASAKEAGVEEGFKYASTPSFDSRQGGPGPYPTGGAVVVHKMPGTPVSGSRGGAVLPYLGVLEAMPDMFEWDPDGSLNDAAMARKAQAAKDRELADKDRELASKNRELAAKDVAHAEELARVKDMAQRDAALASLGRFMAASSAPAQPRPKSLLQEAREERAAKEAEARQAEEARFRQGVIKQMEMYPPDTNAHLYSHLGDWWNWPEFAKAFNDEDDMDDDNIDPAPTPLNTLLAKPNGHVAPAPEPAESMSMGVKWAAAGLTLAAIVAVIVRFPLR